MLLIGVGLTHWMTSLAMVTPAEQATLIGWFPQLGPVIEELRGPAARVIAQIRPSGPQKQNSRLAMIANRLSDQAVFLVGDTGIEPVTPYRVKVDQHAADLRRCG